MKSRKKKKDLGGYGDLISGLPDALICHILSFLPTKEAASTTVLAKRWKPLLAFVPNLYFDDSFYFHPPMTYEEKRRNARSFMRFVDRILALKAKAKAPLKRFHVKCEDVVDQYWVLEWIPKVLKRGVLDIDLHIPTSLGFCSRSGPYPLPSKIFVSKTLVKLKIEFVDGVTISVKRGVSLPMLKILHLDYVRIETSMFNKLLSGCNALEELVLINLMWDESYEPEPSSVTMSIPTLKRLKFCRSEDFYEAEDFEYLYNPDEGNEGLSLSLDNPSLVYLEYSDTIADRYQQVSFDSLVEANLRLRMTRAQIVKVTSSIELPLEPEDKINVTNLLMGIRNVKILYLSDDTLRVLTECRETIPVFDKLVQLTIKPYAEWECLPALLKNCPNLETLVFEGLQHDDTNRCGDEDGCLCKYDYDWPERVVRTCLLSSPVKVLKILQFEDYDDDGIYGQIEQVKYFLETMPDLEQMILHYNTSHDEEVMDVCKQLKKLSRVASAKCNVQIISDNLSLSSTVSTKRGRRSFSGFKNLR